MKQEATKKSKKLLWLWIVLAALVLIVGAVIGAIMIFGGEEAPKGPVGGRPDLYWNLDKAVYTENSESGLSTREPGEDGVFRVRFAYNGQQVELPIVDKQLVNYIDTFDVMGLVFDADGVVVDVLDPEDFVTPVAQNAYVQQVMEDRIIANSSIAMNGMQYTIELCDLTEIYDVSDTAEVAGEIIEASDFQPMDSIWVFANDLDENTHIYMTEHPVTSSVYWRSVQKWSSAEKATSRVPDENGVYHIEFCADGGLVTLKCKDKSIVTSIDNKSPHSCHFGFIFDEEGYIIDIINSGVGIRGAVAAERIEITQIDGRTFSGTQLIPSDKALSYSATLPEDCVIYDASSGAIRNGCQGQKVDNLQLGDRVCVWTDTTGTPKLVYIANRLMGVPAYFNLVRQYNGTKLETKREPNASGYYEFEMVETGKVGKQVLKTKDKELATFIDSIASRIVGLKVENGIILNAYKEDDIFGWTGIYGGYVPQIQGAIVSLVGFSKPDSPTNVLMKADYKCYDVSGKDVPYGSEATLRIGDFVNVTRDVATNGVVVYITRRLVDGANSVYYLLDRQWDSTKKETKRVPDEDGWYVFLMAHNGKQVKIKTKDRELANKIEASPSDDLIDVLRVSNGIAYEIYDTASAFGQSIKSGWRVSSINGDGTYNIMNASGTEMTLKMADDLVIYNVSPLYDSHKGERIYSLRVGDMVVSLADYRGNVKMIYVRNRYVDKMYANTDRRYETSLKETLRQPDADGYYWFDLAVDGKVKQFKTKDKAVADKVDSYTTPFGLRVKGDEILAVVGPAWVDGVYKAGVTGWDVTSVSGGNVKIKFNKPGYTNTGATKSIYVGSNVKVYDISPTAKNFGEAVKLKVGDRILTYVDRKDNVVYVYVLHHATREGGSVSYCEHCKQNVFWHPWAGESLDAQDAHIYLSGDKKISTQTTIGNTKRQYEIVLDLNGNKLTVDGARAFLVYREDTLTIMDSVGGGLIEATGINNGSGGTFNIQGKATVNLYGGTLSFIDSAAEVKRGAVAIVSGATFNMYGGTVKNGIVNSEKSDVLGGNFYLASKAVLNMYGGVIENGQAIRTEGLKPGAAAQGGNLYINGVDTVANLYGGEVRNGFSNQHGGNIFVCKATLNLLGTKVYGGECLSNGGNIYNQLGATVNINEGVVEKGKAGGSGNNYYSSHEGAALNINGGVVTGDLITANGTSISVSGAPKVTVGEKSGLSIPSNIMLTLGELTEGAEIYVNARGTFSEPNNKAQAYVDAGYIKAAAPRTNVVVVDNALTMQGEVAWCEHCSNNVEWVEWTGSSSPKSGHYFLAKDIKQVSQISIVADTDVVLDLYGHKYTSEKIRNFLVRGTLSVMDSVGGGEMLTTGGEEFAGSIALVGSEAGAAKPGCFNLYSGTLRLAEDHPTFANGGLISFSSGTVNVYGGTMIGGYVSNAGGCITSRATSCTLNIYGGTITGGSAGFAGDCIYSVGKLNIEGGVIEGEVYADAGTPSVTLSGTPKIDKLHLNAGILANVSGLTDGAKIGLEAEGVFTKTLENPLAYMNYFECLDTSKQLASTGTALQVAMGQAEIDALNSIHTKAEKMTADGVFAAGGDITATCPVCDKEVTWKELNALESQKITEVGHYYLSADATLTTHYSTTVDMCIHLNGHNITSAGRALYAEYCDINLMGEGVVTGAPTKGSYGWNGVIDAPATVSIFGGTYVSTNEGAAVAGRSNHGDSINIYDGASIVTTNGNGIGVRVYDEQDLNMYGGKISGYKNNIVIECGKTLSRIPSVNIYGGTIENGVATLGGNIYASGVSAVINISGGTITGASVYGTVDIAGVALSGAPVISKLDLTSGVVATLGNLTTGADIGVVAIGPFTAANTNAKAYLDAGYFKSASIKMNIREENNILVMEVQKSYCEHCDQEVEWTEWTGTNSPVSGHYYLAQDFTTQTKQLSIVADTDVVIDLMGNRYITGNIRNFLVRGKLSIMDTVGNGEMVVAGDPECYGSVAMVNKPTDASSAAPEFNLYSGTLRLADTHAAFAEGGVLIINSGSFNMYGGTITGGEATARGGNVSIASGVTFNMTGGQILGGTAPEGGSVLMNGIMNMTGGTIDGEVLISQSAGDVTLANDVTIGKLIVSEGKLVDVSALTTGAKIGIQATGVFTKPLTDAQSYLAYFEKTAQFDTIEVQGDALAVISQDPIEAANAVHTKAEKMTEDGVFDSGDVVTAVCPVCGTEEQWQPLNPNGLQKIEQAGHYYLAQDIVKTYTETTPQTVYSFSADACLHLNGKTIDTNKRAFYVDAPSRNVAYTLNIMGEGTIKGDGVSNATANRGGALDAAGNMNIYGGTYLHTNDMPILSCRGYGVQNVVNIYDGTEIRGEASFNGPSVMVRAHTLNIYGGLITGGNGGNIHVNGSGAGVLNVYGGTIEKGVAAQGGNIRGTGTKSIISIEGGKIVDGDIYVEAEFKGITVAGDPEISNLDLTSGKKLTIGELETGASIGITAEGAFSEANANAAQYLAAAYFKPVAANTAIEEQDGVLSVVEVAPSVICEHCNQAVEWTVWPGTTSPASGHYYIDGDYTAQTSQLTIAGNTDVVLDLRGHSYTTSVRNFLVRGKLSIVDTVGGGEMVAAGVDEGNSSIAFLGASSDASHPAPEFNLYGGTLRLADDHAEISRGGILHAFAGTINIYDGTISGGVAKNNAGNIGIDAGAFLNIYGGEILGGTAPVASSINMQGTMTMTGGTVDGEVLIGKDAVTTISGAAKITNMNVEQGALIDVSGLTTGAKIGVQGSGVFTKPLTNAADYLAYFEKVNETDVLDVSGDALSVAPAIDPIDEANAVHTKAEKMTADGVFDSGDVVTAVCPVCGTEEQWIDLAQIAPGKLETDAHYYLSENVENTVHYSFNANACLHLNGHNITSAARAIYVEGKYDSSTKVYTIYTLNIMGEGVVSGYGTDNNTVPRGTVDIGGSVNFYGGTYVALGEKNPAAAARGFVGHSIVNIYDGAVFTAPNVNFLVRSQAVNVYGGEFTNGMIKVDGASNNNLNIYGGTIANANENQTVSITAAGAKGILTLAGGVIGDKIEVADTLKTLTLTGAPEIQNLDLTSGKKPTIDALDAEARIYVTANGVFTDALTDAESYLTIFKSADKDYEVAVEGSALTLKETAVSKKNKIYLAAEKMTADGVFSEGGDITAYCPVCEKDATWKDITKLGTQSITEAGHYYFSEDVANASHYSLIADTCIHFNGKNIDSQQRAFVVNACTANFMGNGNISGVGRYNSTVKAYFGVLDVVGTANLYGGTFTATAEAGAVVVRNNAEPNEVNMYEGTSIVRNTEKPGIAVRICDHGEFNMYGGLVSGGTGTGNFGGNFTIQPSNTASRTTVLRVYGGTIEKGTAEQGGNIYAYGKTSRVEIYGGNITEGDVFVASDAKLFTVAGDPVISDLELTGGKLVTLGELTFGAKITVNAADGAFTETSEKASKYVRFFETSATGKVVKVEEDALVIADA